MGSRIQKIPSLTREENTELIELVEQFPALWDSNSNEHRDAQITKECWRKIFDRLNINKQKYTRQDLKFLWKNLRDTFRENLSQYLSRRREHQTAENAEPRWWAWRQLQFLRPFVRPCLLPRSERRAVAVRRQIGMGISGRGTNNSNSMVAVVPQQRKCEQKTGGKMIRRRGRGEGGGRVVRGGEIQEGQEAGDDQKEEPNDRFALFSATINADLRLLPFSTAMHLINNWQAELGAALIDTFSADDRARLRAVVMENFTS